MSIKPGSLNSMWYGQSENNYREVFRVARDAGKEEPDVPVVMFFDEVDAVGAARGSSLVNVHDRVMQSFMAELDGLESRGNILVLAASNRRDAIDPALDRPGRLGDEIIEVPRPNRSGSREIFAKYLSSEIPYYHNGDGSNSADVRENIIDSAISTIFSPNGDGDLANIKFRDGKSRKVKSGDLVSGAVIAKIVCAAIETACMREIETGTQGLQLQDVLTSVCDEFDSAARCLTRVNCRNHISDLPQDMDIVSVEPVTRNVRNPHSYINLNIA